MAIRKLKDNESLIHISLADESFLFDEASSQATQIRVEAGVCLNYVFFFNSSSCQEVNYQREIFIGAGARVKTFLVWLGRANGHLKFISQLSTKSSIEHRSLYFLLDQQNLKIIEEHNFIGPESKGRFYSNGLLAGQSQVNCNCEINILPKAQDSDSRIDLKLHLLSPQAKGTILPALKIAANRVRAGHGATTASFGPEDLFYLRSRGLSEDQAKSLLVQSAARLFANQIPDRELGKKVLDAIIERL